jgi:hydrogenase expression/formation protein HypE
MNLTRATGVADEVRIVLAHGGGGELTRRLVLEHIVPRLGNPVLAPLTDAAVIGGLTGPLAFTTDAFVVQPLEFPGGDIGRLAVCGTVNDLAMAGAVPRALSLALVLEEGLPLATLDRVLDSIAAAAREAGVIIATGDTKVIERRGGDGLLITTAGIGAVRTDARLDARRIAPGDVLLVSGRIAEHGLAVLAARGGLGLRTDLQSDVAPLGDLVGVLLNSGVDVKFLRDPTRGGLAGVCVDLAEETGMGVELDEAAVPLAPAARHLAEVLGLDPLTVANEGKCVAVVPAEQAHAALAAWRAHPLGRDAAVVGWFAESRTHTVELLTGAGGRRRVLRPYGEDLPRIC